MGSEQFSLCWDNFHRNMSSGMHSMLETEDLVDVTLAIEGQYLKAHKMVLSVCSPYFRKLFSTNPCKHPIVFMKDVSYLVMNDLLTFMYQGEVQVNQENLASFIKTAEALQIRGLTSDSNETEEVPEDTKAVKRPATEEFQSPNKSVKKLPTPAVKKPKLSAPMNNNSPVPASTVNFSHQRNSLKPEVEAIPVVKTQDAVQFKMEPYESAEHTETYEGDVQDTYIEEDSQLEEDYSAMEDEPKAGTSGDGLPDSQDDAKSVKRNVRRVQTRHRFIHDGFVYHTKVIAGNTRYMGCSEIKKNGCRARAILPNDSPIEMIKVTKPHNHPPDNNAEEKYLFIKNLKEASKSMTSMSLKRVYDTIKILYPNAADEITFKSICSSLHRWRRDKE